MPRKERLLPSQLHVDVFPTLAIFTLFNIIGIKKKKKKEKKTFANCASD
jgi:predicted RNase H-like nuclease